MKTRKLIEIITKDAKKLYSLIKEINVVWPSTHLQIIEVMLQNMACYSPEAANWNDEARLIEIEKIVKALRALVADEAQKVSDVIKKLIVTQICNARLEKKIVELDKKIKEYET